jgi:AcrR family transcriptional regulator
MDADTSPPPPPAPRTRVSTKGVARRAEILDRAIEVFAVKGATGTSLRAIAESIGVSHAALLHYFPSREKLLVEVVRANEERRSTADEKPRDPVVGMMVSAAKRNVGIPGLVALYTSLLAGSLEPDNLYSREYFASRFERIRGELIDHITAGQDAGRLRADVDPAAMAALVIAASDGLQIQWLLEPNVDITASLELLDTILEVTVAPDSP